MAKTKNTITYGGWYQRTTLHLSEVYDFFTLGKSKLALDSRKLKNFQKKLELLEITRESTYLEYIKAKTKQGIEIRYYEDGLYILEISSDNIEKSKEQLEKYYNDCFSPAIAYIFSLGAPTPKLLANMKVSHPTIVKTIDDGSGMHSFSKKLGHVYGKISSKGVSVLKSHDYTLVHVSKENAGVATELVENLIFFREFKDQLEKYLQIHRNVWEEIAKIKNQKEIPGKEVESIRSKLDGYQTAISLINNRINQMGSYVRTRAAISKRVDVEDHLVTLFQFKFETLTDTLEYIKEIWKMTNDYLLSSIQNLVEIKNQSTSRGIQSLQVITSIGVISAIIGFITKNEFPKITAIGAAYFVGIISATWFLNYIIGKIYNNKKYSLNFRQRKEDI
jgi:hypothetical protein